MKIFFVKKATTRDPFHVECEREMPEEVFARKVVVALIENPNLGRLDPGSTLRYDYAVTAHILGVDIAEMSLISSQSEPEYGLRCYPNRIQVRNVCDGELIQVAFGDGWGWNDKQQDHYYFRRDGDSALDYYPIAKNCEYHVEEDSPAWPWIYFFPEKFRGVMEFAKVLEPNDENPLTGLVSSKDAPIRTLAKQLVRRIDNARDRWIRDIVASL